MNRLQHFTLGIATLALIISTAAATYVALTNTRPRPGPSVTAALINGGPIDASPALGAAVVFPVKEQGRVGR